MTFREVCPKGSTGGRRRQQADMRSKQTGVTWTEAEYMQVKELACRWNLTVSATIRELALRTLADPAMLRSAP